MTRVMTLTLPMIQIALFSLQCFCQGQEFGAINGTDRDGNLTEVSSSTSCIKTYDDLESYVKGNRHVIAQLKGAFFVTGRRPSVFVNLTYNFLVLNVTAEHVASCTSNYIWSDQFFYLLGPRPLLWFTLFAVIVREHSATIDLTELFLCSDVYDSLLSRFTYMVCIAIIIMYGST